MKLFIAIALSLSLLVLCGCDKLKSISSSLGGESEDSAVGHYVDGYNKIIDSVGKDIVQTYFKAIPESGPKELSRTLLFPEQNFAAQALSDAKDAFAAGKTAGGSSFEHLAGLADELLAASQAVTDTYGEAQKYYAAENYKDDQGVRAKELHTQMLAQADRYRTAVHNLSGALDTIEDARLEAELKQYEAAKGYRYWFRKMLFETKKLLTAVQGDGSAEDLAAAFAGAENANQQFTAFIKEKGGKNNLPKVFQSFVQQTDNFFIVATRLHREYKADKPNQTAIGNDEDALLSAYNVVVELGNALYEVEPLGQLD